MHTDAEVGLESWQAAGHPPIIEYDAVVMNAIRSEAIDGLNRMSRGGLEIGGILFGRKDGDRIRILSHRSLPCEYALGPSFTLSPNDERALESLLASTAADRELAGLQAVGWYHSHTRNEILLSEKDVQLFDRHFPEPWQIALVVRPFRFDPTRAGFFFRETDGSIHTQASYCEFSLKPQARGSASRPVAIRTQEPVPAADRRPAAPAPDARGSKDPAFSNGPTGLKAGDVVQPPRRRWTFAAALAVLAALTAAISFFYSYSPHAFPGTRVHNGELALRVFDRDGQLRIDWDRDGAVVRHAESAVLEISDGGEQRRDALDIAQLRNGSVTYVRASGDIIVRLRVTSPDRQVIEETARFMGPSTPIAQAKPARPSRRREAATRKPIPRSLSFAADPLPQAPVLPASTALPPVEPAAPKPLDPPSTGTVVWTGSSRDRNSGDSQRPRHPGTR